ncbi:MAG: OmpH family outer membrane protein [Proteobacteria bacterium]|nr:OmpH family outer membrane protein [Pseudomonadota bacterium]
MIFFVRHMNSLLSQFFVVMLCLAPSVQGYAQAADGTAKQVFGLVNLQKLVGSVPEGVAADKLVQATIKRYQPLLESAQVEVTRLRESLNNNTDNMTVEQLMVINKQYSAAIEKFRQLQNTAQSELVKVRREGINSIIAKMQPIINQFAKENGLIAVLRMDQAGFVYADQDYYVDITDSIIALFAE